jgi:hypothetical protein
VRPLDLGLKRIFHPGLWRGCFSEVASVEHLIDQVLIEVALTNWGLVFGWHGCVLASFRVKL